MNSIKILFGAIFFASAITASANPSDTGTTLQQRQLRQYEQFISNLKDNFDVTITKPDSFSIVDIRGHEDLGPNNINPRWQGTIDVEYIPVGAILEADNMEAAFIIHDISRHGLLMPFIRNAAFMELELRNIRDNMELDVNPLFDIIDDRDMLHRANADTVAVYEFDFSKDLLSRYRHCIGIYLQKAAHPAMYLKIALTDKGYEHKDEYMRLLLDNFSYGENPDPLMVYAENADKKRGSQFNFPTRYRTYTGILPDINDETLEEINRRKEWLEAHGMQELPQVSEKALEALNGNKAWRIKKQAMADSINRLDIPYNQRIYPANALSILDRWPQFPGEHSYTAQERWIKDNLKYPAQAKKKGIQGKVILDFTVMADGSIDDIIVNDRSSNDPSLRKEAIRLVKSMPKWVPAMADGHEVCAKSWAWISFVLPSEERAKIAAKVKTSDEDADNNVYSMVDVDIRAEFPGGEDAMNDWFVKNINYTDEIIDAVNNDQFKCVPVSITIGHDGSGKNPNVELICNTTLSLEALRVVEKMPKWIPAFKNGKPVATSQNITVYFKVPEK